MKPTLIVLAVLLAVNGYTQNTPITINDPVVTVVASSTSASEAGPTSATFAIRRTGSTSNALAVFFALSGTASNGVDYQFISNSSVVIAAGDSAAHVLITPIDDSIVESNEFVVLHLQPSPLLSPINQYFIGSPSEAAITILDNDRVETNHPPTISIVSPTNNTVFAAPADITIFANPSDSDGSIAQVEFFAGTNRLGVASNNPTAGGPANPWHITWLGVPPGNYYLRAKATDNLGAIGWSSYVYITVRAPETQQPIVNVVATDPEAAEPNSPGAFRFTRSGNSNVTLNVSYAISGTASNGVDYETLSGSVTIPAGVLAVEVPVVPIDDTIVENTESVIVTVRPPICPDIYPPPADCYLVGVSNRATVYIRDNDVAPSNARPTVVITAPTNNAGFTAPANITVSATATDSDGSVISLEFFANGSRIGPVLDLSVSNHTLSATILWSDVPVGKYALTARAIDNLGATGFSTIVNITVRTNEPPRTNPPVVTILAVDAFAVEGPFTNCCATATASNYPGVITNIYRTNVVETNTALFRVLRSGSTSNALTVNYAISGTASNGADYEQLSGVVTIPAGAHSADIKIIPIDDELAEGIETVVLALVPSPLANVTSDYMVGWPNRAAAIIVDNDVPRPSTTVLKDALFHLCASATNGFIYRLECSTNLLNWMPVYTNTVVDNAVQFVDPDSASSPLKFYRWVQETNSPAQ